MAYLKTEGSLQAFREKEGARCAGIAAVFTDATNVTESQGNSEIILKSHVCPSPPIYPPQLDDSDTASVSFPPSESQAIACH